MRKCPYEYISIENNLSYHIKHRQTKQEVVKDPVHFLSGEYDEGEAVAEESEAAHNQDEDALHAPAEPVALG